MNPNPEEDPDTEDLPPEQTDRYQCYQCGRTFDTEKDLNDHKWRRHGG